MSYTKEELSDMGITALKKLAKELGITGYSKFRSSNKGKLEDLILEAQGETVKKPSPRKKKPSPRKKKPSPRKKKSPAEDAKDFDVGEVRIGGDGNPYIVAEGKKGKFWRNCNTKVANCSEEDIENARRLERGEALLEEIVEEVEEEVEEAVEEVVEEKVEEATKEELWREYVKKKVPELKKEAKKKYPKKFNAKMNKRQLINLILTGSPGPRGKGTPKATNIELHKPIALEEVEAVRVSPKKKEKEPVKVSPRKRKPSPKKKKEKEPVEEVKFDLEFDGWTAVGELGVIYDTLRTFDTYEELLGELNAKDGTKIAPDDPPPPKGVVRIESDPLCDVETRKCGLEATTIKVQKGKYTLFVDDTSAGYVKEVTTGKTGDATFLVDFALKQGLVIGSIKDLFDLSKKSSTFEEITLALESPTNRVVLLNQPKSRRQRMKINGVKGKSKGSYKAFNVVKV
jgi:hypothetical protein